MIQDAPILTSYFCVILCFCSSWFIFMFHYIYKPYHCRSPVDTKFKPLYSFHYKLIRLTLPPGFTTPWPWLADLLGTEWDELKEALGRMNARYYSCTVSAKLVIVVMFLLPESLKPAKSCCVAFKETMLNPVPSCHRQIIHFGRSKLPCSHSWGMY